MLLPHLLPLSSHTAGTALSCRQQRTPHWVQLLRHWRHTESSSEVDAWARCQCWLAMAMSPHMRHTRHDSVCLQCLSRCINCSTGVQRRPSATAAALIDVQHLTGLHYQETYGAAQGSPEQGRWILEDSRSARLHMPIKAACRSGC